MIARWTAALLTCAAWLVSASAWAQYPDRPIRIIVPFPAGDGLDVQARLIGQKLADRLGQQVVIDNKPGAGTLIGMDAAVKSPGDGYTIVLVTTTYAINPSLRDKVPYDPLKDFTPVIQSTAIPLLVVASNGFAAQSFAEVLAMARKKPGELTMGNSGLGTAAHIGMELLNSMAGVKFTHVPYKGIPPAMTDLISGRLQMLCTSPAQVMGQIRDVKIKALATTGARRMSQLPQVGTVREAGVAGFEVNAWVGYMVPSATPRDVVQKLNREMAAIITSPEIRDRLTADGSEVVANTPEAFATHVRSELDKWGQVIRAAGIKAE
ncbi:MAG: tripartite tricarboxylate transporter substrate binding protein [Betaproteobacteria bacterium]|jgi:tripartite-type tricarboxylate transporter receptor subunit TctC